MGFRFVLHCVVFFQSFSGSRVKVNHAINGHFQIKQGKRRLWSTVASPQCQCSLTVANAGQGQGQWQESQGAFHTTV